MDLLPRYPETDLVTRADMHASTSILQGEMAELRGETSELRGEMNAKFGMVDEIFAELRIDIYARFDQQQLWMIGLQRWMIGMLVLVILAVVGSSIGVVMVQGA